MTPSSLSRCDRLIDVIVEAVARELEAQEPNVIAPRQAGGLTGRGSIDHDRIEYRAESATDPAAAPERRR